MPQAGRDDRQAQAKDEGSDNVPSFQAELNRVETEARDEGEVQGNAGDQAIDTCGQCYVSDP